MLRALIISHDEELASQLAGLSSVADDAQCLHVSSWQNACLQLSVESYQIALVTDPGEADWLCQRLRYVQPDLIVLPLTEDPRAQQPVSEHELEAVTKAQLESEGLGALHDVWRRLPATSESELDDTALVSRDEVLNILSESAQGENVQSISFGHLSTFLTHRGELSDRQARALMSIGYEDKQERRDSVLVQFHHLPEVKGDWLVYTRTIGLGYKLQLVAWPHTALHMLRVEADSLAGPLARLVGAPAPSQSPPLQLSADPQTTPGSQSYVLVWRPIERLPEVLHIPLRRTLVRTAQASGSVIHFLDVRPDLIHMVVACPPGRKTIWAAHQFKSGSETAIKEQFGVPALLWAKGYYAAESSAPLSETELDLFLSRSKLSETV